MNTVLSFRHKFRIIVILTFFFTIRTGPLISQTHADTIWADRSMDGTIGYFTQTQSFVVSSVGVTLDIGDGYDMFGDQISYTRSFVSFDISEIPIDSIGFNLLSAEMGLYQIRSVGNGTSGIFPIWEVPGGDTLYCIVDHIDYGEYLDLGDWTAGDEGDSATLQSNIGVLSDSENVEYKKLDVTEQVTADINSGRTRSQYRIRFPIDTDDPNGGAWYTYADYLMFLSGNDIPPGYPYLLVVYDIVTGLIPEGTTLINNTGYLYLYPNPFNTSVEISYSLFHASNVTIEVFDLLSRKVKTR